MRAPLPCSPTQKLVVTQLFASMKGGTGEAYSVVHGKTTYQCYGHAGLDIACPVGTPVYAMKAGVLSVTPHDPWFGGYGFALGLYAVITLPSGETQLYGHLSEVLLPTGRAVNAGQEFARSGATGNVTGPHLHCCVRPPKPNYANGFDGVEDCITHFDLGVQPLLDLSLV